MIGRQCPVIDVDHDVDRDNDRDNDHDADHRDECEHIMTCVGQS